MSQVLDRPTATQGDDEASLPAVYGLLAEFEDVDTLLHAAAGVRRRGFTQWDCYTPFPVHGLNRAMGLRPTVLPFIVLAAGLIGAVTGLGLQLYTMATTIDGLPSWAQGYKFIIGGKPFASVPAFIPVMFELTVLFAAGAAFVGMLLLNGLPRLHHPVLTSARFRRATDDRFFIAVEASDPVFEGEKTADLLRELGAVNVEELRA
jgi:hypothetical protein